MTSELNDGVPMRVDAAGLASPLGGLFQACAAHRAGIQRPSSAPDIDVMCAGDESPDPIVVRALRSSTYGFTGVGRLTALAVDAILDLLTRVPRTRLLGSETGFFWALPDPLERGFLLGRDGHDDLDDDAGNDHSAIREGRRVAALSLRVRTSTAKALDLAPYQSSTQYAFGGGHVAFANALRAARRAFADNLITRAVVIAVDSFVSSVTLTRLLSAGRLKTASQPHGFQPGEVGVAVLLEPHSATNANGDVSLTVDRLAFDAEERGFGQEIPSDGRALAGCAVRAHLDGASHAPPTLLSDHDGEQHRASELANAQVQLVGRTSWGASAPLWLPALGFGNTGAASAALALCLALRGVQRRYAPSPSFLVLSADDAGGRAAMSLRATSPGASS